MWRAMTAIVMVVTVTVTAAADGWAQDSVPPPGAGGRVRLSAPGLDIERSVGWVVAWEHDTLVFGRSVSRQDRGRTFRDTVTLAVPTALVATLESSVGRRSNIDRGVRKGVVIGSVSGLALGVLSAAVCTPEDWICPDGAGAVVGMTLGGAIEGALIGLIVGAFSSRDEWRPVALDRPIPRGAPVAAAPVEGTPSPQWVPRVHTGQRIRVGGYDGIVQHVDSAGVTLAVRGGRESVTVPVDGATPIAMFRATREHKTVGALVGLFGGMAIGAVIGSGTEITERRCTWGFFAEQQCWNEQRRAAAEGAGVGALLGTVLGIAAGSALRSDVWDPVPSAPVRVSLTPWNGGFAVGATVEF